MTVKFEVGKKYISYSSGGIFECVATDNNSKSIFRDPTNNSLFYPDERCTWTLHKEPKRGTVWVNVYGDSVRGMAPGSCIGHPSRDKADFYADEGRLACIEVPWVEGQGLE